MQKAALTKLSVGAVYGRLEEGNITLPHRCGAKRDREAMEAHHTLEIVGRADANERLMEEYS
jgi:hypothetical protein